MTWSLACPDWEQRLRDGRPLIPDLPLDRAAAARGVAVFDRLRLADVPGTPRLGPRLPEDPEEQEGDAAGQWFRDIVAALFGSYDRAARRRMIREIFCLVSKKNSKTSYGGLLMVAALLLNERPRAPFIFTAPVMDTADLAFSQAAGAIALDPVLEKKLHVRDHLKTIVHRETKAELEIMAFDPAVVTGKKPVGVLIDELHVIAKMAKAASALRQLRGGMLPFPEAFLATITTQSEEAPVGVFKAELQKARDVRDGKLDAPILPVLYEFPREMQVGREKAWRDPANWIMVTPNAGKSISIERLREEFKTAEHTGEEELRAWASQHLNVEIGLALKSNGWAGAEYWEQQADESLTLEEVIERCEVLDVGIDGGGLDDLLGLSVVGRCARTGDWLSWSKAWAHPIVLKRNNAEAPRFTDFADDGDLELVQYVGEDVAEVAQIVAQVHASGKLDKIGADPAGIGAIVDALVDAGIDKDLIVGISQGWKLNGAIKTVERALAGGTLWHGGRPLMAWCASNAKVEPKGNAIVITKEASGFGKIDPLMALIDAVSLLMLNPAKRLVTGELLVL